MVVVFVPNSIGRFLMNDKRIINIDGVQKEIPSSVDMLGEDDLYMVPFSMLALAPDEKEDEQEEEYHWHNPRRLGKIEGNTLGRGLDKQDMQELYTSIKDEGLMLPFVARWIIKEDGNLSAEVVDGERRWRCIDRQIKKVELVKSRKLGDMLPATDVHAKVICRVVVGDDKDALRIAFMVSDRSVPWGEGATAKLIKKLRKAGFSDEDILKETKKSFQWLREMDEICNLDELTFDYLTDGRINRALGLRLAKIEEIDRRHKYLHASYDDAVQNHQEELAKADEDLEKAEQKEEVLESELAEVQGDTEAEKEVAAKLEAAKSRTQSKRQKRQEAARPRAKTKNLRNAAAKIAEEEEGEGIAEDVATALRPGKIRLYSDTIANLIGKNGKDEDGKEVFTVATLHVLQAVIKGILGGEEDVMKILLRQRNILRLQAMRGKNVPPPDIAADLEEDEDELESDEEILGDRLEEDDDMDDNE